MGARGLPARLRRAGALPARERRAGRAGAAEADGGRSPRRAQARQVGRDRCAGGRARRLREPELPGRTPATAPSGRSAARSTTARISSASARASSSGCAGICTSSSPSSSCRPAALDRRVWLERLGRRLARAEQTCRCGSAASCRALPRAHPARRRARARARHARRAQAPRAARASRLRRPHGRQADRRDRRRGALRERGASSPCTPAWHRCRPRAAPGSATASTAPATVSSTARCTGSRSPRAACHPPARAYLARKQSARAESARRPCAASSATSPAPSTARYAESKRRR